MIFCLPHMRHIVVGMGVLESCIIVVITHSRHGRAKGVDVLVEVVYGMLKFSKCIGVCVHHAKMRVLWPILD